MERLGVLFYFVFNKINTNFLDDISVFLGSNLQPKTIHEWIDLVAQAQSKLSGISWWNFKQNKGMAHMKTLSHQFYKLFFKMHRFLMRY